MNVTATTRAERALRVAEAIHSTEMEGLSVGLEMRVDADLYVEGAIEVEELVARTRARYGLAAERLGRSGVDGAF